MCLSIVDVKPLSNAGLNPESASVERSEKLEQRFTPIESKSNDDESELDSPCKVDLPTEEIDETQ